MNPVAETEHELESLPSLRLGVCALVLPSLCRVSGLGLVLGFRRFFARMLFLLARLPILRYLSQVSDEMISQDSNTNKPWVDNRPLAFQFQLNRFPSAAVPPL
jgi:hypothetical protein